MHSTLLLHTDKRIFIFYILFLIHAVSQNNNIIFSFRYRGNIKLSNNDVINRAAKMAIISRLTTTNTITTSNILNHNKKLTKLLWYELQHTFQN